jgi:DNA-binding MarR family transcriptional regulator
MAGEQAEAESRRRRAMVLWIRIARIYGRHVRRATAQLEQWDLTLAQFDALVQIGAAEGLTQQQLAARLLVTQGNVTQLLDKLEGRGLIRRCREGRIKRLVLTDAGRRCYAELVPAQELLHAELFAALAPERQRQLMALLRALDRSDAPAAEAAAE